MVLGRATIRRAPQDDCTVDWTVDWYRGGQLKLKLRRGEELENIRLQVRATLATKGALK
jgi:hypothetical protein